MIGHQQSLQQLQTFQNQDIKPSLSPKSSNTVKGSLFQQQEKLKKIVNLQSSQPNIIGSISPNISNSGLGKINATSQMSKSNSSSILPPQKNAGNAFGVGNRSTHIKTNNLLHLSNSIDHDYSQSYMNPFNYISIKSGTQSTTPLYKGQNQSVTNINNSNNTYKQHNMTQPLSTTLNFKKTPQNNNSSSNQPFSSQILTATSQNSNSSKTQNFFVSPKVKKRQNTIVPSTSQPESVQQSAHKASFSKKNVGVDTQPKSSQTNNNSQILEQGNGFTNKTILGNLKVFESLQEQLNQNVSIPQQQIQTNQKGKNNTAIINHNSCTSSILVSSPSNYQQYQILNSKTKKIKNLSSTSNNNIDTQNISKKKKKKTEESKNSCILLSPQSNSYISTNFNNNFKNTFNNNLQANNNAQTQNFSKQHNNSQTNLDQKSQKDTDEQKIPIIKDGQVNGINNIINGVGNIQKSANGIINKHIDEKQDQNKGTGTEIKNQQINSLQENQLNYLSTNSQNIISQYTSANQEDYQENKQISSQSDKYIDNQETKISTDDMKYKEETKKKKKYRKKSPLGVNNFQQKNIMSSKSSSQSRNQKSKQRVEKKRKYLKTSQSPCRSQNKSYSTHIQASTDNHQPQIKQNKSKKVITSIKSSDNLENNGFNGNTNSVFNQEGSKTQQNSLEKNKKQSIDNAVRLKDQIQQDKLFHTQELIKQNLQKNKLQKMIFLQKQKQEQDDRQKKSQHLTEINEQIRHLNSQKSPKRDQITQHLSSQMNSTISQHNQYSNALSPSKIDHKLPWGANQQKIFGTQYQNLQKINKNKKSDNDEHSHSSEIQVDQIHKQQERIRRERLGLGFLNDKNDSFVEQIVQSKQLTLKQINQYTFIINIKQKAKKKQNKQMDQHYNSNKRQKIKVKLIIQYLNNIQLIILKEKYLFDAQRLSEIHKYMIYKKGIIEQKNLMKSQEMISKISKIKENKHLLESNIRQILKRLKYSNKMVKNKNGFASYKINSHQQSQYTDHNGAIGPVYHLNSQDSFHQNYINSQNGVNIDMLSLETQNNNDPNNYSYLYEEYKNIIQDSLKKTFLFTQSNHESHASSKIMSTMNEQSKIKSLKTSNKIKQKPDSLKKDKKQSQEQNQNQQNEQNYNSDNIIEQRGRERILKVKSKFENFSQRFKKLLEHQIGGNNKNQTNQNLSSQQMMQNTHQQLMSTVNNKQKDQIKNGFFSLQNKNSLKTNDDIQTNTNGFNTTTTTQNALYAPKTFENNVSVPATSKNQSVIIKDTYLDNKLVNNNIEDQDQNIEEEQNDNAEITDQDYYYIAVQYLNQQALLIQKIWRGYLTRKIIQQLKDNLIELNSNWLQKQEKMELNDFYNNNKENDSVDNHDKIINISTIKSSMISVNEQFEDMNRISIPEVFPQSPGKQNPSIVKEEDSSQNISPQNNKTYQDDNQKQNKYSTSYADKIIKDQQQPKQTFESTQSYQQDILGLKDLVIQKFNLFSSQLQNAQNLNTDDSKQILIQLQQLTENYKNEVLSSFQNTFETNQFLDSVSQNPNFNQSKSQYSLQERGDQTDNQSPSCQSANQSQQNSSKNDENKYQLNEEIDNVLIKNNEDNYEDKSLEGIDGQTDSDNDQVNYDNAEKLKNQNNLQKQIQQNQTMKQELNQLYLLLTQEANKDKEKKYYLSSQGGNSNQNSYRNSQRLRTYTDERLESEQRMQTSIDSNGQELVSSSLFDRDSFKLFTEKKLKELQKNENVEEIIRLREQAILMRHTTQVELMNKMLQENAVSPRTYTTNKQKLDKWAKQEQDELKETKQDFEKSLKRAIESISKTKQDYELTKKYKESLNHNEPFNSQDQFIDKNLIVDDYLEEEQYQKKYTSFLPEKIQVQEEFIGEQNSQGVSNLQDKNRNTKQTRNQNQIRNEKAELNKFKDEQKTNALRELSNSYNTSESQISKTPPESLSNRKLSKKTQQQQQQGQKAQSQENLIKVEDIQTEIGGQIPEKNGSSSCIENKNQSESQMMPTQKVLIEEPIDLQKYKQNDDFNMVEQQPENNKQSSSDNDTSQSQLELKNPKIKDQLWDSSPHHNLDTSSHHNSDTSGTFKQKNRERFTNEKMLIKGKDDIHITHNKKSPRLEQNNSILNAYQFFIFSNINSSSSFSDSKDTNKDLSPKSDINELAQFNIEGINSSKNIQPNVQQNTQNNLNNNQNNSPTNNQQQTHSNNHQLEKKDENHSNFNAQAIVVNEVFNSINEEIKEKWRMNAQVEERLNEQLNKLECIDKSDKYGIPSNLFVIEQYILSLFQYVKSYYKQEFVENINTPFGFSPQKRLKLIHGYDSFIETTSEQQLEEFSTLPFVLSEELFIEFEQNIIGNGEEEKDQIIKEFQHIHNKAIFDTFNESLNLFRPYFALGGSPYAWSKSEKNIIFCHASETNLDSILEKAKKKVIEWASFLCGIINEHENFNKRTLRSEEDSLSYDKLKDSQDMDKSPLQSLLENNNQPENEYFAQSREERLSRMLLVEVTYLYIFNFNTKIFENEYKWQLYEDEKAEVLMELSDLVFEELVEEIVDELAEAQF